MTELDQVKVCPRCCRCADTDNVNCPYCGHAYPKPDPAPQMQTETCQKNPRIPRPLLPDDENSILIAVRPVRMSFIYNYGMAFAPVFLAIICIFVRSILENIFQIGSSSLTSAIPTSMSTVTAGITGQYSSSISIGTTITILLIAPIAIFFFVAVIGWTLRWTELWTSTAITLGLSFLTAAFLLNWGGFEPITDNTTLEFLLWVAYLVQVYCIIVPVLVIVGIEKFRLSLRYTVMKKGVWIRGGLFGIQEHMIPHHQIGRIVLEQDFFGSTFGYGTLIPLSITRWGNETSIRGIGVTGQKDNVGFGIGFAKAREEGSRHPLDCLFGIPDPRKVQKILATLMCRQDVREEEQVTYLKKIYEVSVDGAKTDLSDHGRRGPVGDTGNIMQDDISSGSPQVLAGQGEFQNYASAAPDTRMRDFGTSGTTGFASPAMREIPSLSKPKSIPGQGSPPPESVLDQIKKLASLRDSGIITEDEFLRKKTELLKRI